MNITLENTVKLEKLLNRKISDNEIFKIFFYLSMERKENETTEETIDRLLSESNIVEGASVENKGNPYRAKDGKFTFGPNKAKDSSKPKMTSSQALYSYQDYGYRDINDYLRLNDKKNLDDYDKKRLGEITGDSSRLSEVKEQIEAIDSAFNSDEARTGGSGHRIDTGIATDIFSSTEIGDMVNKLKEENLLPENHTEWYDTKVEGAKRLEDAVKSLVGTSYKFKSYVSTDAEMGSAYDRFSQGNTGISSLGMETYVKISSNRVKTLRVNDFTGMDSYIGQDNPENEILFNRNSTFEIYHATIMPMSAEGYSGPRGEGFQLVLYMKDVDKSNNSADDRFDNKGNPYRAKDGKFTTGPSKSKSTTSESESQLKIGPKVSKMSKSRQAKYDEIRSSISSAKDGTEADAIIYRSGKYDEVKANLKELYPDIGYMAALENVVRDKKPKPKLDYTNGINMYHGTNNEFKSFSGQLSDSSSQTGVGKGHIFFTDSKNVAKSYGKNVKVAKVTVKRPLIVDANGNDWSDIQYDDKSYTSNELANKAQSSGYDSLVIENVRDTGGYGDKSKPSGFSTSTTMAIFSDDKAKIVNAHFDNKGNPYRAKDGKFTFGPAGPKEKALRSVDEIETSSPSPEELYDYIDGNLPEREGDPYKSWDYDSSFEGMNKAERDAWINNHVIQNAESDYDEEIANYVGKKDYNAINTYLRNPEQFEKHPDEVARLTPLIDRIKKATQADTVQGPMSTYRAGIFTEDYMNGLKPGTYVKDNGIVSTSMSAVYSTEFGARRLKANNAKAIDGVGEWKGNILFRVNSKPGQKGIYADTRRTADGTEFEWIPAYGSQFYITDSVKFTDNDGRFVGGIVDVDVYQGNIPQGYVQTRLFNAVRNAAPKESEESDYDRFVWTEEYLELWVPETDSDDKIDNKGNPYRAKDGKFTTGPSKPLNFRDDDTARDYILSNYSKASSDENDSLAILSYAGIMYRDMNTYLRNGKLRDIKEDVSDLFKDSTAPMPDTKSVNDRIIDYTARMSKVISKTSLKENTTLYRVANLNDKLNNGDVFIDKGFSSTSLLEKKARNFLVDSNPIKQVLKINAKKGQNGVFTNSYNENLSEAEFVLPRDTMFTVTGMKKKKGYELLEVEIQ